ncbi:MAG: transporter substrate-binding domain-containing protein [Desulfovibrionaceae bacterium]
MRIHYRLALSLAIVLASLGQMAQAAPLASLSQAERDWLAGHPDKLVLWYDGKYPPVEYQADDGSYSGLTPEIIARIEDRLGVTFIKKPALVWANLLPALENGNAPVVSCITNTPERNKYAFFTKPYMTIPAMVITTKSRPEATGLESFRGLRVAAVEGYITERYLREHYAGVIETVPVPSVQEGLRQVSFGLVDAMLENVAIALYYIDKETLSNLRVAGGTDLSYSFAIAVSHNYPLLFSAVRKALDDIPPKELKEIDDKLIPLDKSHFLTHRMQVMLRTAFSFIAALAACLGVITWFLKRRLRRKEASLQVAMRDLEEKDERLKLAMKATRAAIWDLYPQTGEASFSAEWYAMLGYAHGETPESYAGWAALTHPEDLREVESLLGRYMDNGGQGGFEATFRMRTKTGAWLWVLGKGQGVAWDAAGKPTRLIGMNVDIHNAKMAQEALKASEEKFSRLFQFSPDAIALLSLQGLAWFLDVNNAFTELFGFSKDQLIGKSIVDLGLIRAGAPLKILHEKLQHGQSVTNLEVEVFGKGERGVLCSLSCQRLTLGNQPCVLTVFRDITENKRMQEMMVQTEKMLSVGGIAAGIAHEINNPLAIVLQSSQNLAQRVRPDLDKNMEAAAATGLDLQSLDRYMKARKLDLFIQNIQEAALRASEIIRHMLHFSRHTDSRRVACGLGQIIDRALALANTDFDLKKSYDFKRIQIHVSLEDALPPILCSETEIEQILLNLLRNAAQAIAKAEPYIENPRIDITATQQDGWVRLVVRDNGPGMTEEVQKHALEPFFTTKEPGEGTGLGLSVSYFIVTTGHGGRFTVASQLGEGSTFTIELPLGDSPQRE